MSVLVQYAPYHLKEGQWDAAKRDALGNTVIKTLAEYAPNIEAAILDRHVLSPLDLEETFGLTEGNIYHGELTMDQVFFMRPVPECAGYSTPIAGLYLCGAGTHPGGGVNGASGYNAARKILKREPSDVRRPPYPTPSGVFADLLTSHLSRLTSYVYLIILRSFISLVIYCSNQSN